MSVFARVDRYIRLKLEGKCARCTEPVDKQGVLCRVCAFKQEHPMVKIRVGE